MGRVHPPETDRFLREITTPFNVRFWRMGNEAWGCGGNMRPEYYADELKRYASFLPAFGDVRPFRIADGQFTVTLPAHSVVVLELR